MEVGKGGSGIDLGRFQALRENARKKLDAESAKGTLTELLQKKQKELGLNAENRGTQAKAASHVENPQGGVGASAMGKTGNSPYGRFPVAGAPPSPGGLGLYVDIMA